jgi:hypothetical protein
MQVVVLQQQGRHRWHLYLHGTHSQAANLLAALEAQYVSTMQHHSWLKPQGLALVKQLALRMDAAALGQQLLPVCMFACILEV